MSLRLHRHDSFLAVLDHYTIEICLAVLWGAVFGIGLADHYNWVLLIVSAALLVGLVAECMIRRRLG